VPLSVLRILLYVQLLLGLVKYGGERIGLPPLGHVFDFHELIGVIVAILAIYALRPLPGVQDTGVRMAARFFPLLPLVLGIGFVAIPNLVSTPHIVLLHMVLGIATIALVEIASAQQRRSQRRRPSFAG
jgi:hypothetical protein